MMPKALARQLTADEQEQVRVALRYLRARLGAWVRVARVAHLKRRTVRRLRAGWKVRPYVARNVAAALGTPSSVLLTGRFLPPGSCPHCGYRVNGS